MSGLQYNYVHYAIARCVSPMIVGKANAVLRARANLAKTMLTQSTAALRKTKMQVGLKSNRLKVMS
ncbi:pyruvate formate lyase family protein [Shigella sonnei]